MFDFRKLQLAQLVTAREMEGLETKALSVCQSGRPWDGARPQGVAGRSGQGRAKSLKGVRPVSL